MDCLFCSIVRKEIPAHIIFEDDNVLAFHDISPQAPQHVLVIPKKHVTTLNDVNEDDAALMGTIIYRAKEIAAELGVDEKGYRLVLNCNQDGGQSVFHIHCQ